MLKWHVPYPSILHWKEHSWERARGRHKQGHMARLSEAWAAHPSRRNLKAQSPWLPWLVTWLCSSPCYCNPSEGHLLCSCGRAGLREKRSAALHPRIRSITPRLLNCSWRLGHCVWSISKAAKIYIIFSVQQIASVYRTVNVCLCSHAVIYATFPTASELKDFCTGKYFREGWNKN